VDLCTPPSRERSCAEAPPQASGAPCMRSGGSVVDLTQDDD